jgi:glutamate--cysteine ligase
VKGFDDKLIDYLLERWLVPQVFEGNFGLEKENVRVDEAGKLALTPHPKVFGDKLKNPYITTDFSESQVEMVTPACRSIPEVYNFLENLQNIVSLSLEDEYLWPQSNPPILPEDKEIPIANFENEGKDKTLYREKLGKKYGRKKQLLSGIHYNFSFKEELIKVLHEDFGPDKSYQDFKNDLYLKITKNFLRYRWLLIYLTGASPIIHYTYGNRFTELREKIDDESYYYQNLCSIRNSRCGYKNIEDFIIGYNSLDEYTGGIQSLISAGKIESPSEFYSPIRLKTGDKRGGLEQLKSEGIKYLELRFLDLNPFAKNGITIDDLYLVHLFMIYLLLKGDLEFTAKQQETANMNHDLATVAGMRKEAKIYNEAGGLVDFRREALKVLSELGELVRKLGFDVEYLSGIIHDAKDKVVQPEKTCASRLIEMAKKQSYIGFHLQKAKEYLAESRRQGIKGELRA